jgi:thioredoxin
MKFIKRILPILFILAAVTACGARAGENKEAGKDGTEKKYTVTLNQEQFLKKVSDFKTNLDGWKYLGDKPAIIDFYADWCTYCKKLAPVLEELAKEYEGQLIIYKVNTDNEREIATAFGIRALPTLLFIPMEGMPEVAQGAVPKAELKKYIESFLLKKSN